MKPYSKQHGRFSNEEAASSGSSFNYGLVGDWLKTLSDFAQGIWGNGDNIRASMLSQQLKQQQQTNTILWVVIGLVLALGVVLVVRKTK